MTTPPYLTDSPCPRGSSELPIAVGRVTKPHGVKGAAKIFPFFEEALFSMIGHNVTVAPEKMRGETKTLMVESVRGGGASLIIEFKGFTTPEQVRGMSPAIVVAPKGKLPPLPEGRYYYEEIIGLPVFNIEGVELGLLADFFTAGEKDVWSIKTPDGGEILTPCLPETIIDVDLEKERITVQLMEWVAGPVARPQR